MSNPYGKFSPNHLTPGTDLARQVEEELNRIASVLQNQSVEFVTFEELHAEPAIRYDGMIVRADGTDWDPGTGQGVYVYIDGTGWVEIGAGSGVTDHGALTGLSDDDHTNYLHKDVTRHITVGYTTDIEAVSSIGSGTLTPDLTAEHLKTITVTGNFTLGVPANNGYCEYYVTVTGAGPWTITAATYVTFVDGINTLTSGNYYILSIRRFSATNVIAQLTHI